jgi:hypothetical protein
MTLLDLVHPKLVEAKLACHRDAAGQLAVISGDRAPVVIVEHARESEHAIVLIARIAHEAQISPRDLLLLAGRMGAGALALMSGHYVVRFVIPAAQVETAPLAQAIAYVGELARAVAAWLVSPTAAAEPETFGHCL